PEDPPLPLELVKKASTAEGLLALEVVVVLGAVDVDPEVVTAVCDVVVVLVEEVEGEVGAAKDPEEVVCVVELLSGEARSVEVFGKAVSVVPSRLPGGRRSSSSSRTGR